MLEAGIQSCLRTIARAQKGAEEAVFAEQACHAIRYAYKANWKRTDIIDRLDNAGEAIGLDADTRQRVLSEGILRTEITETAGEVLVSAGKPQSASTKSSLPLRTITPI